MAPALQTRLGPPWSAAAWCVPSRERSYGVRATCRRFGCGLVTLHLAVTDWR